MSKIFDENSDSDYEIKTNNEYAKNYETWRKKEELNKFKTKYGEDISLQEENDSSSSSDDEEGIEITKEVEKEFFKTLSYLKNKDPKIYDKNVVFFENASIEPVSKKKKKDQPMFLNDYERKIVLEKNGIISDEENDCDAPQSPTYIEEQQHLKKNLKNALENIDDNDNEENWGGLFKVREKTREEKVKEDADYKSWLAGQTEKANDEDIQSELKPLKEFWSNPNLDQGEQFLRDYILKKKFLSTEDENYIPTYDEIVHDSDKDLSNDEDAIEKQEEFEHKFNFRFEEPDQDFIKRYPRTIESSMRKSDDKRSVKRAEVKERKKKEKEEKMADLKKLQELKRKEIEEKIEKLKEITGNTDVGFKDEDIDGDFDPEAHDRRMQALFSDSFYEGPEDEQKPEFSDIDEELEIENWNGPDQNERGDLEPHCEDDNFNMDADYDPNSVADELEESTKGKKKRKRKSKFAEAVSKPKPKYDPNDKNFEKYFEEYYKLDCEDIIGDIPCRFKYREVIPNSFGLTIEEILMAKDRELNKWCSLKKAVQYRPDHVEKYEQIAYSKKGENIQLKSKILPSLFNTDPEEQQPSTSKNEEEQSKNESVNIPIEKTMAGKMKNGPKIKKFCNNKEETDLKPKNEISQPKQINNKESGDNNKLKKKKKKKGKNIIEKQTSSENIEDLNKIQTKKSKETKDKSKNDNKEAQTSNKRKRPNKANEDNKNKKKFKKNNNKTKPTVDISDARLSAYGINPKKFKNKAKYGTQ